MPNSYIVSPHTASYLYPVLQSIYNRLPLSSSLTSTSCLLPPTLLPLSYLLPLHSTTYLPLNPQPYMLPSYILLPTTYLPSNLHSITNIFLSLISYILTPTITPNPYLPPFTSTFYPFFLPLISPSLTPTLNLQAAEANKIDMMLSPLVNDLRQGVSMNNSNLWIESVLKRLNRYRLDNQAPMTSESEFVM